MGICLSGRNATATTRRLFAAARSISHGEVEEYEGVEVCSSSKGLLCPLVLFGRCNGVAWVGLEKLSLGNQEQEQEQEVLMELQYGYLYATAAKPQFRPQGRRQVMGCRCF